MRRMLLGVVAALAVAGHAEEVRPAPKSDTALKTGGEELGPGDDRVPFADPHILYHDGTYYAYGTFRCNEGIGVATSKDLRTWRWWAGRAKDGFALHREDSFGDKYFWAPEVYWRDGRFVMHYSADRHVCAAVAESPLGPFVQAEKKPILEVGAIDNSLFADADGSLAMFHVAFDHGNVVWSTRMEADGLRAKPGTRKFVLKATEPWEIRRKGVHVTEGPFVILENGVYYLTYSANDYRDPGYGIGVATATSIDGPWRKSADNPIFQRGFGLTGTGHHSFFKDAKGAWRIVFHAHRSKDTIHPRCMYIADVVFAKDRDGHPTLAIGGELITCRIVRP